MDGIRWIWVAMALNGCVFVVDRECTQDVECDSDELCWTGQCEAATERYWGVSMHATDVGWAHPDGSWDTDLSPPDLFVEFGIETDTCVTSYVPDSFEPAWYEGCDFFVPYDPVFSVSLWGLRHYGRVATLDALVTYLSVRL